MNKYVLTVLIFLLHSYIAHSQNAPDLKEINNIEIHFFKGKQPNVYKTRRNIDLTYLKRLIKEAQNKKDLLCDTTGEIIYFKNQTPLFKAYFCTRNSGSKYSGAVMFQNGTIKIKAFLNYGSGMLIDEVYYQFQK